MTNRRQILFTSLLISGLCLGNSAVAVDNEDIRGITKSKVEAKYGAPSFKEGPVGEPPITKWVYDKFTIVFEYDHVLHSYKRDYELERRPSSSVAPRPDLRARSGDTLNLPD